MAERAIRRDVRAALEWDSITVGPDGTIGMLGKWAGAVWADKSERIGLSMSSFDGNFRGSNEET